MKSILRIALLSLCLFMVSEPVMAQIKKGRYYYHLPRPYRPDAAYKSTPIPKDFTRDLPSAFDLKKEADSLVRIVTPEVDMLNKWERRTYTIPLSFQDSFESEVMYTPASIDTIIGNIGKEWAANANVSIHQLDGDLMIKIPSNNSHDSIPPILLAAQLECNDDDESTQNGSCYLLSDLYRCLILDTCSNHIHGDIYLLFYQDSTAIDNIDRYFDIQPSFPMIVALGGKCLMETNDQSYYYMKKALQLMHEPCFPEIVLNNQKNILHLPVDFVMCFDSHLKLDGMFMLTRIKNVLNTTVQRVDIKEYSCSANLMSLVLGFWKPDIY